MAQQNVVKKEEGPVAETMPDYLKDQTTQRGTENVTSDDLVIPRLEMVQALSPCRKKTDPAYIPGAEEGMLYNNVTRELYGDKVQVVPVFFRKEWIVWKLRTLGGGFVGAFSSPAEAQIAQANQEEPDDYQVNDTTNMFCLLIHKGSVEEIVVSMAVTKLKISRKWNSLIRMAGGDSFSRVYTIGTAVEQNKQGQDYYNYTVAITGFPAETIYRKAEALYDQISTGNVKVDQTDQPVDAGTSHKDDGEF